MFPSLTKCLLFADILILAGCTSAYRDLKAFQGDSTCLQKFIPEYRTNWFNAKVDVAGKHISGLLLIKTMPDTAIRVVFTNEAGIKFFDFEFRGKEFKVQSVMKTLDRKVVINTLRKDFELILIRQLIAGNASPLQNNGEIYYAFPGKGETVYIVTNKDCTALLRLERASKNKTNTEAYMVNPQSNGVPDSVHIRHLTFDMQIDLKKLEQ